MTIEEPVVDVFGEEFQRTPYGVLRAARARARYARDPFGSLILLHADDFEAVSSDGRFGAFGDRLARMLGLEPGRLDDVELATAHASWASPGTHTGKPAADLHQRRSVA